ncbi:MAG TPA: MIP/aquaporin family protein [Candidatus Methanoculleus thermohydrogenotrophicum]|jgi:glycerol uptake facilitator protein|nr:MIP/aquaporin family protein [Candidatus Methanoculleus thermohydrogenotrophicum]NLM82059.1 aquaporin family protein [Candidatus Methanoculleus thermohydrogenotrophicum]HOB17249.1 MIP/aquaporin family protein [Candidatus Methanoculleus thermohydrogenotrophicum]HPZ37466.1 MIP/aquaporin family protein [Candidatus Methanoculleus thermohydrogenotrophicum]HQC90857.1 MIP/aquaporin family protein [Candidatus Methanoculleus thermohydrogenotrophicum]
MTVSLGKRSIAEAVGTFILVFFGAGAAAVTLMLAAGTTPATPFNVGIGALGGLGDWLAIGLAFGIAIAGSIYALGRISGCHINPAVTLGLFATGRFPGRDVIPYLVAQFVGAAAASLLFAWAVGPDAVAIGGLGATAPFPGIGYLQAIVIEAIGTFLLMLVIMGAAVDERATPGFAGLAVGLTVAGIITTTGNLSGASLNPARTFGPYLGDWLLGGQNLWGLFPIYIIGPIIGAVLAAFLYDYLSGD